MKTLILNGSPHPHGDTAQLIDALCALLPGEVCRIDTYRCGIAPCVDCRWCWEHPGCTLQDGMEATYAYAQTCDNILIASPIYFSEVTGRLLDVASRFQTYFTAAASAVRSRFRGPSRAR